MSRSNINSLPIGCSEKQPFTGNRNEPCVVPDPDAGGFVNFYGTPGGLNWYRRQATDPQGTWSSETTIVTGGVQKPYILQDKDGTPVKIGGVYVAYLLNGTRTGLHVYTASTLTGTWTDQGSVYTPQAGEDNFLAMSALYDSSTIYLFYSYEPTASDATYGWASRGVYATASTPTGTYTKQGSILEPSTNSGDWDYGWIGGMQVFASDGGYVMVYNASNTRPAGAPGEPATSLIGFAYSSSITGPYSKAPSNPIPLPVAATGIPVLEDTNLWRGFMLWDTVNSVNELWFNTGAIGTELISYMIVGIGNYNWTQITNDTFHRANGGIGNSWTDQDAGNFNIVSNTCHASTGGSNFATRPGGEDYLEQLVIARLTSTGSDLNAFIAAVRGTTMAHSNYTCYFLGAYQSSPLIKRANSTSETDITGTASLGGPWTNGHTIRIEFACRTPVAGTTNLWASWADETAGGGYTAFNNSQSGANTVVADTNGSVQSAGLNGIGYYGGTGVGTFLEFTNYRLTQTGGITIDLGINNTTAAPGASTTLSIVRGVLAETKAAPGRAVDLTAARGTGSITSAAPGRTVDLTAARAVGAKTLAAPGAIVGLTAARAGIAITESAPGRTVALSIPHATGAITRAGAGSIESLTAARATAARLSAVPGRIVCLSIVRGSTQTGPLVVSGSGCSVSLSIVHGQAVTFTPYQWTRELVGVQPMRARAAYRIEVFDNENIEIYGTIRILTTLAGADLRFIGWDAKGNVAWDSAATPPTATASVTDATNRTYDATTTPKDANDDGTPAVYRWQLQITNTGQVCDPVWGYLVVNAVDAPIGNELYAEITGDH